MRNGPQVVDHCLATKWRREGLVLEKNAPLTGLWARMHIK